MDFFVVLIIEQKQRQFMTRLTALNAENFKMDGGACFGVVPKTIWGKYVPSDSENLIEMSSRCLLVEKNDKIILIDTGMGNKQSEKFFNNFHLSGGSHIENELEKKSYNNDQITDVILTHLHFDHVGGAVKKMDDGTLKPTFPNATYHCSKLQWDWANNPNPREKASYFPENFIPLSDAGQLNLILKEGQFSDEIELRIFNGHTRGQIIPIIKYKDRKIVYAADFIPSVWNIPLAYVASFDIDPLCAMKEKESFLKETFENNYVLFFEHDYYHECCTVKMTEKGIKADQYFRLDEI